MKLITVLILAAPCLARADCLAVGLTQCIPMGHAGDCVSSYEPLHLVPCGPKPVDRSWHVLVQTYGGTVSILKGLTHHEADFISKRLLGQPATPQEEVAAAKAKLEHEQYEHELAAQEEAEFKAQAPRCPPIKSNYMGSASGSADAKAWDDWLNHNLKGQLAQSMGGCVKADGSVQRWAGGLYISSSGISWTNASVMQSSDIKSAEVFQ